MTIYKQKSIQLESKVIEEKLSITSGSDVKIHAAPVITSTPPQSVQSEVKSSDAITNINRQVIF